MVDVSATSIRRAVREKEELVGNGAAGSRRLHQEDGFTKIRMKPNSTIKEKALNPEERAAMATATTSSGTKRR
jgi:hypothetical protein